LISEPAVLGLLGSLDDREGIVGEENLGNTAALSTRKLGAKGPRVSVSGPTTTLGKRMGPRTIISSS